MLISTLQRVRSGGKLFFFKCTRHTQTNLLSANLLPRQQSAKPITIPTFQTSSYPATWPPSSPMSGLFSRPICKSHPPSSRRIAFKPPHASPCANEGPVLSGVRSQLPHRLPPTTVRAEAMIPRKFQSPSRLFFARFSRDCISSHFRFGQESRNQLRGSGHSRLSFSPLWRPCMQSLSA